jgi:hypothetical protein
MSLEPWILDATRHRPITREITLTEFDAILYVVWVREAEVGWSPVTDPLGRVEAIEQARRLSGDGAEVSIRRAPDEWAEAERRKAGHEYP